MMAGIERKAEGPYRAVVVTLTAVAMLLCWEGVAWAFRGSDLYLYGDEIANVALYKRVSYRQILHFFPEWIYNDRPVGIAVERLLFDRFGFQYTAQLRFFVVFHFVNCLLA